MNLFSLDDQDEDNHIHTIKDTPVSETTEIIKIETNNSNDNLTNLTNLNIQI